MTQLKAFTVSVRVFDPAKGLDSGATDELPVDSPDAEHACASTLGQRRLLHRADPERRCGPRRVLRHWGLRAQLAAVMPPLVAISRGGGKKACSFLKERTKELWPIGFRSHPRARAPTSKVFLLLFLQKKKILALLPSAKNRDDFHNVPLDAHRRRPARARPAYPPAASAIRASDSSRPSAASVPSIPGLVVVPVSAARIGCAT